MLTDKMREVFGYDSFGNCDRLTAEADKDVDIPRAGGDVVCRVCGVKYVHHPAVQGRLWATRTCEGIVKL